MLLESLFPATSTYSCAVSGCEGSSICRVAADLTIVLGSSPPAEMRVALPKSDCRSPLTVIFVVVPRAVEPMLGEMDVIVPPIESKVIGTLTDSTAPPPNVKVSFEYRTSPRGSAPNMFVQVLEA